MALLFTIGHSTHSPEEFLRLLTKHEADAVHDIRSHPYSRHNPQFNRETLREFLNGNGVSYEFLGNRLGARSEDPAHYIGGKIQYGLIAGSGAFAEGLESVRMAAAHSHLALMCAEKDPVSCHRALLVCRHLRGGDLEIRHILADGGCEENADFESRLLNLWNLSGQNLLESRGKLIERAYDLQSERIAGTIRAIEKPK